MSQETTPTLGLLPQSTALAEASSDSLSELLSRDPQGWSRIDLDRVVKDLRAQRLKWEAAEAAGVKTPKAVKLSDRTLTATRNAEDLGL